MKRKKKSIFLIIIIILAILLILLNIPQKLLKTIYPTKYENFVELYSKEYDVDKYLIFAIIKAESNFNENAISSKGAKGLMQLMDNTAKYIAITKGINKNFNDISELLLKPDINIQLGTKYISMLIKKYNSISLALVAYNAGSGNTDNWIEQGILETDGSNIEEVPYKETNNYVRKILREYEIYKKIYNEKD